MNASIKMHRTVISPGGSVIYGKNAMNHLKKIATVVYLKISYKEMERRLGNLSGRGVILKEGMTLRGLYEERIPYYERYADLTVDGDGKSFGAVVDELRAIFERRQNMGRIYGNIEELIGHTPIMELKKMEELHGAKARVFAKLECFNPGGSAKDRIAVKMLDEAEKKGLIERGVSTIIEPTTGNTGVGLAAVGMYRGYRTMIVMPENMSEERIKLLRAHCAELVLTDASKGMQGAIEKAEELARQVEHSWVPSQFTNPAGPQAHYETTGPEIWEDMGGKVDAFVCAVGTGGTITGTGRYLREQNPAVKIFAVEPADSPVLSGGEPGPHAIQGIGAGFVPEVLDTKIYDEVLDVHTDNSYLMSRDLVATEGLLVGISSGAALEAAFAIASRPEFAEKNIVVLLPDGGERYLSTELF